MESTLPFCYTLSINEVFLRISFRFGISTLNLASLLALFIYLTFASGVNAQSVQSLQDELQTLSQSPNYAKDTVYLNKANELAFLLAETNPDSAFPFLDNQIKLCRKANFKKGESNALKIYGNVLQNKGDFSGSLGFYE